MPKATKYQDIETGIIRKSPLHWTRDFDPEKFAELCERVKEVGVVTPIVVRRRKDGKMFEYITGDRRFQAARKLKLKTIPCIVRDLPDLEARQISIHENLSREDLSPGLTDAALRELVEIRKKQLIRDKRDVPDPDRTQAKTGRPEEVERTAIKQVAKDSGVSARSVVRAVAMKNLIPDADKAYQKEQISKRQAELLSRMDQDMQDEELQLMLNETQEETEERLKQERSRKPAPALPPGNKGTHNINPAMRLFDRIVVLTRELDVHAKNLRGQLTEESVAALRDLDRTDIVECTKSLTRFLADLEVVDSWNSRRR